MRCDVHVYTVVRVRIPNIHADSYQDAIHKALESFGAEQIAESRFEKEYAEDVVGYLVDELSTDGEIMNGTYFCDSAHSAIVSRDRASCVEL